MFKSSVQDASLMCRGLIWITCVFSAPSAQPKVHADMSSAGNAKGNGKDWHPMVYTVATVTVKK